MTKVSESSRRAARALGERLARVGQEEPRRASFTDVGTIESVLADGTALVSYRGGTIGPLPMTCDCVCAAKGRSCVIAIDGPIVRVIGIVARSSTDFEVPATAVTGTLPVSNGGTGATTASSARSSLGLGSTPVTLARGSFYKAGAKVFIIGHSEFPAGSDALSGYVRIWASWGGLNGNWKNEADVTFNMRNDVSALVSQLTVVGNDHLCVRKDSSGVLWFYIYVEDEYYSMDVRAAGEQFVVDAKWQSSPPDGSLVWSSDNPTDYGAHRNQLYSGMSIGTGLKASGRTLSVDNGAYVRLLWSGMTQSSVTLSAKLAGFRAIAVTIGGSDGVDEGTTLVWSPDGRTFDVTAAFVVGTNDFRVMRMRFSASGSRLTPTVVDGQNGDGYTRSTSYLHSVVGIV